MATQKSPKPAIASTLRIEDWSSISPFLLLKIKEAAEIASREGVNLFLVGGFVRDLLLGTGNLDLDFVVEGDGIRFAGILAKHWGGTLRTHEKFGTAVLYLSGSVKKVDIATARTEHYTHPAALPEVAGSSIQQDLYRRDFSINSMAVKLNPPEFGKLIDFFGGQSDLRHGVLRVLHSLSFVDDPTRIFRAIRFEQRYRLRMDRSTEKLLRQALQSEEIKNLSPDRVREEIKLILSESDPVPPLKRMSRLRILPLIHPKLKLTGKNLAALKEIPKALTALRVWIEKEPFERWVLYGIALLSGLNEESVKEVLEKFKFSNAEKEKFSFLAKNWGEILPELRQSPAVPASRIVKLLEEISPEGILFLYAFSQSELAKRRIRQYLFELRNVRLLVSGDDLNLLGLSPGPEYREWLEEVRNAQLDGKIQTKEEALKFLRESGAPND